MLKTPILRSEGCGGGTSKCDVDLRGGPCQDISSQCKRRGEDFVFDETDGTIRSFVARTGNSNTPATRGTKTSSYASRFRS